MKTDKFAAICPNKLIAKKHLNLNSLLLLSIARIHSLYNYRTSRYLGEKILLTDSQCIECKYRPPHVKVMLHEAIRNDDF